MNFTVIIPARYGSTRLPGKPLLDIAGKPMVQRVYECAIKSGATKVIVATDDQRIFSRISEMGAEVCMTGNEHESGTDRLQEVVKKYQLSEEGIVVNVQGDEPMMPANVINQVARNLAQYPLASCATLREKIKTHADYLDPNVVKVVSDVDGMALYFSRSPIPGRRVADKKAEGEFGKAPPPPFYGHRHIGVYAYRVDLLNKFVHWSKSQLESIEKLEQLRILENAHKIHVADACEPVPGGVDTREDLQRLNDLLREEHH